MSKINEVMQGIMDGAAPVLVGELRGVAVDHIKWVDKVTGKGQEATLCKVTLEVGKYPAVKSVTLTVGERGGEAAMGVKLSAIPRGAIVFASLTGFRVERGVVSASAHELTVL